MNNANDNGFGTVDVELDGERVTLAITQYAYIENDARYDDDGDRDTPPTRAYHADAVDGDGNRYLVTWITQDNFWFFDEDEGRWMARDDEGEACDWDVPASVTRM